MELSENEAKVLSYLASLPEKKKKIPETEITVAGLGDREVSSAVSWLETKGLIKVEKEKSVHYGLGEEGKEYLAEGLPEERLYSMLAESGRITVPEAIEKLGDKKARIALTQLAKLGIKPGKGRLEYQEIAGIHETFSRRREFLSALKEGEYTESMKELLEHFRKREGIIIEKKQLTRLITVNDEGRKYAATHKEEEKIGQLTSEIIVSGEWKSKAFRKYDLNAFVEPLSGASLHPLTYLVNKVRRIFLEMGFSEMKGHYIEHAAWNMDALFIPQDHPAREMQDTFYLKSAKKLPMEHPEITEIVKKTHEKGIKGYTGWEYKFDKSMAEDLLLRTHTTVNTIRYLYEHQEPPVAVFSVEKVFRHESVDWKHLAELHQIEGAVYSKDASISTLKWLMRIFYKRLGFTDIKLIPSYYPYTEPSMDVIVKINGREVELGGSGVFRPEVTKPLGLKEPVIAWGLGLERLAMIYYGLTDIREIYNSDINWLKTYKVRL